MFPNPDEPESNRYDPRRTRRDTKGSFSFFVVFVSFVENLCFLCQHFSGEVLICCVVRVASDLSTTHTTLSLIRRYADSLICYFSSITIVLITLPFTSGLLCGSRTASFFTTSMPSITAPKMV